MAADAWGIVLAEFPDRTGHVPELLESRGAVQLQQAFVIPSGYARFLAGVTKSMLWTIFAILLILWLLGWGFHVAGSLIHLLLVVAVIVAIINLVSGRRTV